MSGSKEFLTQPEQARNNHVRLDNNGDVIFEPVCGPDNFRLNIDNFRGRSPAPKTPSTTKPPTETS